MLILSVGNVGNFQWAKIAWWFSRYGVGCYLHICISGFLRPSITSKAQEIVSFLEQVIIKWDKIWGYTSEKFEFTYWLMCDPIVSIILMSVNFFLYGSNLCILTAFGLKPFVGFCSLQTKDSLCCCRQLSFLTVSHLHLAFRWLSESVIVAILSCMTAVLSTEFWQTAKQGINNRTIKPIGFFDTIIQISKASLKILIVLISSLSWTPLFVFHAYRHWRGWGCSAEPRLVSSIVWRIPFRSR